MRRHVTALFLGAVVVLPTAAQERKAPKAPLAERVAALKKGFRDARVECARLARKAKTREERDRIFRESYPEPAEWVPRFIALAEEDPTSHAAREALLWALARGRQWQHMDRAMALLEKHHLGAEELKDACRSLSYGASPRCRSFLEKVIEKSPHREVRGWAWFTLGQQLRGMARVVRDLAGADEERRARYMRRLGLEAVAAIEKTGAKALDNEAERTFQRVPDELVEITSYGSQSLGDGARGNLFEMRHLAVGMKVPDIVGEDIDGQPMKLSDYRGKVVMIDFWGHW